MIRKNFWRLTIVILLVLWSLYETYPPTTGDLIAQFQKQARVVPGDTTISNIVFTARAGQIHPEQAVRQLAGGGGHQ